MKGLLKSMLMIYDRYPEFQSKCVYDTAIQVKQ